MKSRGLQTPWASIADMMSSLMMVFLLISVTYSFQVKSVADELKKKNTDVSDLTDAYTDNRKEIHDALNERFADRFEEWSAELDQETLTLRFTDPAILFEPGSSELTPRFERILEDLWPKYVEALLEYSEDISEIRIEGHTSSEWVNADPDQSYFNNMKLSQERTRSALRYCYEITAEKDREWVREHVTANGMSFSRLVRTDSGEEDPKRSRRVEISVIVDSRQTLADIERLIND